MKISLVLATYGRSEVLEVFLNSIVGCAYDSFEVLIMDQNPDDRLSVIVDKYIGIGLNIRHVRLPRPGLVEARNIGIRLACGEIIGFPDDDCWYERDTLISVQHEFESDVALSGIVGDWVEQSVGRGVNYTGQTENVIYERWRAFRGGAASSISLFFKKTILLELNGFDSRFGVGKWYGAAEETDLVFRVLQSGGILRRTLNVRVHHAFRGEGLALSNQSTASALSRARGTGALYAKHRLAAFTILRGFLSPIVKPMSRLRFGYILLVGLATTRGRIEGFLRWRREEI